MNGYSSVDLLGRTGKNLSVMVDGQRMVFRGQPAQPCMLKLNGEEAPPSALVYAGDNIEFIPAISGEPARRTLKDLLGADFTGGVTINGRMADLDTLLSTGDQIMTSLHPVRPVPPPARTEAEPPAPPQERPKAEEPGTEPVRRESFPAESAVRTQAEPLRAEPGPTPLREQPEPVRSEQREPSRTPERRANPWEKRPAEPRTEAVHEPPVSHEPPAEKSPARPEEKTPEPPKALGRPIQLTLNGKQLKLPGKEDGSAYYLMDLLEFSGIDFEHLDRGVELQVNGRECAFSQELHPQDDVVIRYLEK